MIFFLQKDRSSVFLRNYFISFCLNNLFCNGSLEIISNKNFFSRQNLLSEVGESKHKLETFVSFGTRDNDSRPVSRNEKQLHVSTNRYCLLYRQILRANSEHIFVYHFVPNNVVYSNIFANCTTC